MRTSDKLEQEARDFLEGRYEQEEYVGSTLSAPQKVRLKLVLAAIASKVGIEGSLEDHYNFIMYGIV